MKKFISFLLNVLKKSIYLAEGHRELNPNLKYWYEVKKFVDAF